MTAFERNMGLALERYFYLDHIHNYMFLPDTKFLPHHEFSIGSAFLVSIPENFMAGFSFPDFGKCADLEFWEAVIAIWLVGSLESLLSASALGGSPDCLAFQRKDTFH